MKKIIKISLISAATLLVFAGCATSNSPAPMGKSDVMKLDVAKVCNPETNSLQSLIDLAKKYNPIAVKEEVEFKRLGITNRVYIKDTQAAINKGSKITELHYKKKGKPKVKKIATSKAAWRACTFAIRAVQEHEEAANTYRLAIPGDGFKY